MVFASLSGMTQHTPETAAACQILYHCADIAVSDTERAILFRAISRLTGIPPMRIAQIWKATR